MLKDAQGAERQTQPHCLIVEEMPPPGQNKTEIEREKKKEILFTQRGTTYLCAEVNGETGAELSLLGRTRRCQRHCLKARTAGRRREKSTESQRDIAEKNCSQAAPTDLKAKRKPVTHPAEGQKAVEEMQKQGRRPASPARTGPAQIHHAPRPLRTDVQPRNVSQSDGSGIFLQDGLRVRHPGAPGARFLPPTAARLLFSIHLRAPSLMRQGASRHSKPAPPCRTFIILILHFDNPVNTKQVSLSLPLPSVAHCSLLLSLSLHPVTPADHFDSQWNHVIVLNWPRLWQQPS